MRLSGRVLWTSSNDALGVPVFSRHVPPSSVLTARLCPRPRRAGDCIDARLQRRLPVPFFPSEIYNQSRTNATYVFAEWQGNSRGSVGSVSVARVRVTGTHSRERLLSNKSCRRGVVCACVHVVLCARRVGRTDEARARNGAFALSYVKRRT